MSNNLNYEDLKRSSLILRRGCYFYNKLDKELSAPLDYQSDSISEVAYFIRSLAEITVGMNLWFKSNENIKALGSAAFIDHANLLVKVTKKKKAENKEPLTPFDLDILEHGKDKYHSVPYPSDKITISQHRKKDELFNDTLAITSKLVHQDEFSILGLSEESEFNSLFLGLGKRLSSVARFWLGDFKNAVEVLDNEYPSVIAFYNKNVGEIPFHYKKTSFVSET